VSILRCDRQIRGRSNGAWTYVGKDVSSAMHRAMDVREVVGTPCEVGRRSTNVNGGAIALGHPLGASGAPRADAGLRAAGARRHIRSRVALHRRRSGHRGDHRAHLRARRALLHRLEAADRAKEIVEFNIVREHVVVRPRLVPLSGERVMALPSTNLLPS
jgi:hypothetical protein